MDRKPVQSSNIRSVGYDPRSLTLEIEFKGVKDGAAIYQYPNVAPETYRALINAPSVGSYFAAHIKARPFQKMDR